jgi:DNA-binding transcriptional MerR regulator
MRPGGHIGDPDLPVFTIDETSRRTGVPASTLRTWERRYAIPRPTRTPAGYRLYSKRHLQEIAALRRLVESGVAVRQAAFLAARKRTLSSDAASYSEVAEWRRTLELACLRFDEPACDQVVEQVMRRLDVMSVLREVIFPVVATLGDGWHAGVISVSQEHFATEVARRLIAQRVAVEPTSTFVVATGCAPREQHELGLLAVVAGLRGAGTRVAHLGCNVPVDAFLATVDTLQARSAVIAVTVDSHLKPWVQRAVSVRERASRGVQFIWAGPGARMAEDGRLPGAVSASVDEVVALVKQAQHAGRRGGR